METKKYYQYILKRYHVDLLFDSEKMKIMKIIVKIIWYWYGTGDNYESMKWFGWIISIVAEFRSTQ
jgi:hypothetical protein